MELLQRHEIPDHFKEHFINRAYRPPNSPLRACVKSVLHGTNETLNFWTHLLPGLYMMWQLYVIQTDLDFSDQAHKTPLIIFMLSAALYPLMSAAAHMFNAHSHTARHVCFFLDYAALSFYSLGASLAYKAYVFPAGLQDTTFSRMYLYIASLGSVTSLIMACSSRFLPKGLWRKLLRVAAFGQPYLLASLPLMYRVLFCEPWECDEPAMYFHKTQFAFAFLSCLLYCMHLPERIWPDTFDVIGHSHQLFHIAGVLATAYQIEALKLDVVQTVSSPLHVDTVDQFQKCETLVVTVMLINATILALFIKRIYAKEQSEAAVEKSGTNNATSNNNHMCLKEGKPDQCSPSSVETNGAVVEEKNSNGHVVE